MNLELEILEIRELREKIYWIYLTSSNHDRKYGAWVNDHVLRQQEAQLRARLRKREPIQPRKTMLRSIVLQALAVTLIAAMLLAVLSRGR